MSDFDDPGFSPGDSGFIENLNSIQRLTRDLRNAARTLSDHEARFLVDAYYAMQRDRIRAGHQERTLEGGSEPHDIMSWLGEQRYVLERQVARALDAYSGAKPVGVWARSITGIGPIISAGLLANIDIRKAHTAGSLWRFAGLDPSVVWAAKTKRPWNASLKRLCWIIGESFVKVHNLESDIYGKVFRERKNIEEARNAQGLFAEQAAAALAAKKFGDDTKAKAEYVAGRLPQARLHLRAQRYAVKLFLSHLHCVMYFAHFGKLGPTPFILTQPNHTHFVPPPNTNLIPGLTAALFPETVKPVALPRKRGRPKKAG